MTAFAELRSLRSLAELPDAVVVWLAECVEPQLFQPGQRLITHGDRDRDCYFITSGETEVTRDRVTLCVSGAGEPEGELALFLGTPRTATTTAIGEVRTLRLRAADYDALKNTDPSLAEQFRTELCRHLAKRFGVASFAGVSADPAANPQAPT